MFLADRSAEEYIFELTKNDIESLIFFFKAGIDLILYLYCVKWEIFTMFDFPAQYNFKILQVH